MRRIRSPPTATASRPLPVFRLVCSILLILELGESCFRYVDMAGSLPPPRTGVIKPQPPKCENFPFVAEFLLEENVP